MLRHVASPLLKNLHWARSQPPLPLSVTHYDAFSPVNLVGTSHLVRGTAQSRLPDESLTIPNFEVVMMCPRCDSASRYFDSEIAVHLPGSEGLTMPLVMIFAELQVCLRCGTTQFTIPETERKLLQHGGEHGSQLTATA